jgi:hypothetical protein
MLATQSALDGMRTGQQHDRNAGERLLGFNDALACDSRNEVDAGVHELGREARKTSLRGLR